MNPIQTKKNFALLLFLPIPFLFYWYTCLPSIGLGDSVLFIHAIKQLKISTWVNNHNGTALWGWFFQFLPIGDIAYRGNLSCVFSSAIAVCIFYFSLYSIHRCLITSIICSLFLMVSQSMWWHATDLADYSMASAFVATALYIYVRLLKTDHVKYLYTLFFLSGLALFQHYLLGSLLVGCAAALLWRILQGKEKIWPLLWKSGIFFFIGLIPWLLTFSYDVSINHSVSQTISGCLGGPFKKLYFKAPFWNGLVENVTLTFLQFPSLYILPVIFGLYFFLKRFRLSAGSIGLLFTFIPVFYFELFVDTWAKFAQLLSTFIILAFWASFTIHWVLNNPRIKRSLILFWSLIATVVLSLVWTIYFYAHLSQWGENPHSIWYSRYNNSYSFNYYRLNEFLSNPNKRNYHDIADACHLMLAKLPLNAEYWDSDSRLFFQMKEYYQQYYHQRLDLNIFLINSFGFDNWGADKSTFAQHIKSAYLSGQGLFLATTGHPFASLLAQMPQYKFKKFYLNDKLWIYKLITAGEYNPQDSALLNKWDIIPTDKPTLINLTLDNLLDFHEGTVLFQQDMTTFGPFWKNDDQIFFAPSKPGAQLGFLLRFAKKSHAILALTFTTAFDAGQIRILLNNTPLNQEPIDLYTRGIYVKRFELGDVSFEKGNNILTIQVIGKSDKSSDMKLGVDTLEVRPQN